MCVYVCMCKYVCVTVSVVDSSLSPALYDKDLRSGSSKILSDVLVFALPTSKVGVMLGVGVCVCVYSSCNGFFVLEYYLLFLRFAFLG